MHLFDCHTFSSSDSSLIVGDPAESPRERQPGKRVPGPPTLQAIYGLCTASGTITLSSALDMNNTTPGRTLDCLPGQTDIASGDERAGGPNEPRSGTQAELVNRAETTLSFGVRMTGHIFSRSFDVDGGLATGPAPDHSKGPGITYSIVSIFCMLLLATMLGSRIHNITDRSHEKPLTFIRIIVFMLYFAAISYVATAAILQSGLDLSTIGSCRAAVYVCLVFYCGSKVLVQLFLVERAHAVRYHLKRRRRDFIWVVSLAVIVLGFGSIAGIAFAYPIVELAPTDHRCRIGVPLKVTVPLIAYEVSINLALTGVFIALLRPLLMFRKSQQAPNIAIVGIESSQREASTIHEDISASPKESSIEVATSTLHAVHTHSSPSAKSLRVLVYKSIAGAALMLLTTIINLGLLVRWKGHEEGWLCFTLCTLDATLSVAVVHYLTVDRRDEEVC
ncbi:hypothetical protein Q7P37_005259 [Cladosporium fusiforme]